MAPGLLAFLNLTELGIEGRYDFADSTISSTPASLPHLRKLVFHMREGLEAVVIIPRG